MTRRSPAAGSENGPFVAPTRTTVKAVRLKELSDLLALRPHGVAELAERFGVTRRTIERDLVDLRSMGMPLSERDHRYALPDRPAALNEVEALAVHSAVRLLIHTGIGERHYRSALAKLVRLLPEPARGHLTRAAERLEPSPDDRILDLVAQAWFQGRVLRCRYASASSCRDRRVELEIWFYELNRRNLEPYALAVDRIREGADANEPRVYKLARMHDARLLPDSYHLPAGADPLDRMEGAWGVVIGEPLRVVVRADPAVAFWFRERRGANPRMEPVRERPDGSLIVHLHGHRAADGDAHELIGFLLGWGGQIEVLDPPDVRERVAHELRRGAARYPSAGA